MRVEIVTPPAVEPVTLAEAKVHLRLDPDTVHPEDAAIGEWIAASRERVEAETGRALVTRTLDVYFDAFPLGGFGPSEVRRYRRHPGFLPRCQALRVPCPPLVSASSLQYLDPSGVLQTLDPSRYRVLASTSTYGRVEPSIDQAWPETAPLSDAVVVRVVAGYGLADAVPASAKSAIKLLLGQKYDHREAVIVGAGATELPRGVADVLRPLALGRYQ